MLHRIFQQVSPEQIVLAVNERGAEELAKFQKKNSRRPKCFELLFGRKTPCKNCPFFRVLSDKEMHSLRYQPFPELPAIEIELEPNFDENFEVVSVSETLFFAGEKSLQKWQLKQGEILASAHENLQNSWVERHFFAELMKARTKKNHELLLFAAHQMQHPIGILRGYLDLFFQNPNKKDKKIIESELDHLSDLIGQFLRLSRLESEQVKIRRERVEFVEFVRGVLLDFSEKIKNRNFKFKSNTKKMFIAIDRQTIEELLRILLENAVKYTDDGGKIEVEVRDDATEVKLFVRDDGRGIESCDLQSVFLPFFRASSSRDTPGSGLGLSIAKKIVECHGGKISVGSEKKNGTCFSIKLPIGRNNDAMRNAHAFGT